MLQTLTDNGSVCRIQKAPHRVPLTVRHWLSEYD